MTYFQTIIVENSPQYAPLRKDIETITVFYRRNSDVVDAYQV